MFRFLFKSLSIYFKQNQNRTK